MRHRDIKWIAVLALSCTGLPLCSLAQAQAPTFEQNYAKAKANAAVGVGAAYDDRIGTQMRAIPELVSSMRDCMSNHPDRRSLHGYYEFTSPAHYRVVLQPAGPFADCITGAMENRPAPAPPSVPYLDPIEVNLTP
ncbi:MAG: hypothetical protein ABI870_09665 [Rhodanobacter sp.]